MLLVMLESTFQDRQERVSLQPWVSVPMQKVVVGDRFRQAQKPEEASTPLLIHLRPGQLTMRFINRSVVLLQVFFCIRVQPGKPDGVIRFPVALGGFQAGDRGLLPGPQVGQNILDGPVRSRQWGRERVLAQGGQ